jgi:hypothetical protein
MIRRSEFLNGVCPPSRLAQWISTSVPGLHIAEGYTNLSKLMQHACVIRGGDGIDWLRSA